MIASDADPFDYFGQSVALDGNKLVVGASTRDNYRGKVYSYKYIRLSK